MKGNGVRLVDFPPEARERVAKQLGIADNTPAPPPRRRPTSRAPRRQRFTAGRVNELAIAGAYMLRGLTRPQQHRIIERMCQLLDLPAGSEHQDRGMP